MAKKVKKRQARAKAPKKKEEQWLSNQVFTLLALVFLIVQIVGLYAAKQLFLLGLQQPIFSPDINDVANSIYLFGTILVMTVVILFLIRMRRTRKLLWVVEALAVFTTSTILFSAFFPTNDLLVYLLTAIVLVARYTNTKSLLIRDIVSMIAIAGAGAFIGISLGVLPVLAFIIALAIYDIIAVFYTKHMVSIGSTSSSLATEICSYR